MLLSIFYFVAIILLGYTSYMIQKVLRKDYFREDLQPVSYAITLDLIITPSKYLKKNNLWEGYRLFLFQTLLELTIGILVLLIIREII